MCDIHMKIMETQDICVTFTQKMVQFHSEKEEKKCGSPHEIRVMFEIQGNKEVYS